MQINMTYYEILSSILVEIFKSLTRNILAIYGKLLSNFKYSFYKHTPLRITYHIIKFMWNYFYL